MVEVSDKAEEIARVDRKLERELKRLRKAATHEDRGLIKLRIDQLLDLRIELRR